MSVARVYDNRANILGEGALWHPERQTLFWFDIERSLLMTRGKSWPFEEQVSAAGWLSQDELLVASETALLRFDLESGAQEKLVALEADNPLTRSNDGRADPWGGFWISTMGKQAQAGAGAIYRYYRGELRQLYPGITIPNAICFAPDGLHAYWCDTVTRRIMRQALEQNQGWPQGAPEVWLDVQGTSGGPDGAVVDAEGNFWNARWGPGLVTCHAPDTRPLFDLRLPARHLTCPAFGGPNLQTLFCTSATEGLEASDLAEYPQSGMTFVLEVEARGQAEHKVLL